MKFGAILLLTLVSSISHGSGGNELYAENYEDFWRQWQSVKDSAMKCSDPEKMAQLVSKAVEMSGNAEVTQANAEVLEEKLLSNPDCVLDGFSRLPKDEMNQAIEVFLMNPGFTSAAEIEDALGRAWRSGGYSKVKDAYESFSGKR